MGFFSAAVIHIKILLIEDNNIIYKNYMKTELLITTDYKLLKNVLPKIKGGPNPKT